MKDILTNLLGVVNQQIAFMAQVGADVAALKTVVSSLGPDVAAVMEKQIAAQRVNVQQTMTDLEMMQLALQADISRLPN